ncbi:hypothetical protein [Roseiarcus sp.]|uniref:hypothetical protein n=1 Tax=Roseiarcus sp. TaxID=1969460 RepID=UPI003C740F5D
MRAATLAGPDIAALARARIAAARGQLPLALVMTVPPPLRNDPGLLFARIQDARRSNRAYEAAVLLELAPQDREALVNSDRWWSERRKVAGELLDLDEPRLAFELCDNTVRPDDPANQVDANFFAGWIALRFLNDARAQQFALSAPPRWPGRRSPSPALHIGVGAQRRRSAIPTTQRSIIKPRRASRLPIMAS